MRTILTVIFMSAVLLAGCGRQATAPVVLPPDVPATPTPTQPSPGLTVAPPSPPTPAPTVAPAAAAPAWLANAPTYTDAQVGFELHYPAGWDLFDVAPEVKQESMAYAVTLNSWSRQEAGGGGIPAGGTKVDILVTKTGISGPAEAAAQRRQELQQDPVGAQILAENEVTLTSGLPATRFQVQGQMGESVEFVTAIDGYTVIVSGLGNLELAREVARTLREVETL